MSSTLSTAVDEQGKVSPRGKRWITDWRPEDLHFWDNGDVHAVESTRPAGALIGVAGAIGAFGGVLVNLAFRQSLLATKSANDAYVAFVVFYAICFVVTYLVYVRKSDRTLEGV